MTNEVIFEQEDSVARLVMTATENVQNMMDQKAREYGYDDIRSAISYADEPSVPKFQVEGCSFRAWRSAVWAACFQFMEDVKSGSRPMPKKGEVLASMPAFTLIEQ